jgi:hypothetical protein
MTERERVQERVSRRQTVRAHASVSKRVKMSGKGR